MLDSQLIAFVGVAIVISITPGPDMALVMRNCITGGRSAGYRTIAGIGVGLVGWGTAAAAGVAAVLAASATVFTALKLVGAVYLAYLGLKTLLALRRGEDTSEDAPKRVAGSPFRQGLITNLFNPKLAVLFTTLLPQFVNEDDSGLGRTLVMVVLFVSIGLTWLTVYMRAVDVFARNRRVRRAMQALTGVVMLALGGRLAITRS